MDNLFFRRTFQRLTGLYRTSLYAQLVAHIIISTENDSGELAHILFIDYQTAVFEYDSYHALMVVRPNPLNVVRVLYFHLVFLWALSSFCYISCARP